MKLPLFIRPVSVVALSAGAVALLLWWNEQPLAVAPTIPEITLTGQPQIPTPAAAFGPPTGAAAPAAPVAVPGAKLALSPRQRMLLQPRPGTVSAQFFGWLGGYLAAKPADRPALVAEGRRLAAARRAEFKVLIARDPRRALAEAVPMVARQQLPPEIVAELEERVNERATLQVYQGTPEIGAPLPTETLTHRIAQFADRAYVANVYGERALNLGTTLNDSINGVAVENQLAVNEEPARVLEAGEVPDAEKPIVTSCPISGIEVVAPEKEAEPVPEETTVLETPEQTVYLCGGYHKVTYYQTLYAEGGTGGPISLTGILPAAPTPALGTAKILYIPMTFADQNAIPATESKCYEVMRDVADYYAKSSYGRLTTLTTVTPPIKLPHNEAWYVNRDTTNGGTIDGLSLEMNHAREEAKKLGFDHNDYDCTVLRLNGGPRVTGGWGGSGSVWIYSDGVVVTAHEIGHSFGLSHANFWDTAGTSAIGAGTNAEYGDIYDVMGSGGVPIDHYNAQAKNQVKWLPNDYVTDVAQSGLYRIHAFDQPVLEPANRYAIRIVKDTQRTYWGEVRQLYNGSTARPWADKGLILGWRFPNGGTNNVHLIDTTPGTSFGKDDAAISLGRTFSDLESGIHFTTVEVSATTPKYVDVVVNFGLFPGNNAPALSLAASADVVPVGATVTFTATASDLDGDALAYSWQHFGDTSVKIVSPNAPTMTRTFTTAGTYVVTCTVSDMKGGTRTSNKLITVGNGNGRFTIAGRVTAQGVGLGNVIVNANGANAVTTDSDGYYVIPNLGANTYSMTPLLYGYTFSEVFNNSVSVGPNFTGADFVADTTPRVSLAASLPTAQEASAVAGRFTIMRTGDTSQPLSVNVNTVSGTATYTTDYAISPAYLTGSQGFSTFTIPADAASLEITLTPIDDAAAEGPETVVLQLGPGSGYAVSNGATATVTIEDNDTALPKVSVEATIARTSENSGQPAVATFTRSTTSGNLTVFYTLGGTAVSGGDFTALAGSVVIPAGSASATVNLAPLNDAVSEPTETVTLTTTANAAYLVNSAASAAAFTIVDDDVQIVSVTATDASAAEVDLSVSGALANTGTFLITRSGDTSQPLTVFYSLSGQITGTPALHGVDFDALPGVLVIPAGATSASVTITPRWDNLGEGPETVILNLGGGSTYYQLSPTASSAAVTIADNATDLVYLEVIGMTNAAEPGTSGVFRLSAKGAGTGTITVNYTISGTAAAGADYTINGLDNGTLTGSTTITLNNGTATKDLSVVPANDALAEELETITFSITSSTAYTSYGPTSAATMWLRDDDQPTVYVDPHVTTYPPSLAENGSAAAFYLSRTGSTAAALTVNYTLSGTATNGSDYATVSGTATIPAGAAGVDVAITPINDTTFEGTETIIFSLASGAYARGPTATLYLTDNETSTQFVGFANSSGSGSEAAGTINVPVNLTSAATAPVTVEYVIDSGPRNSPLTPATTGTLPALVPPYWVRVERAGSTFRSYFSTDGTAWVRYGNTPTTIAMSSTSYLAGLMTNGGVSSYSGNATLDNVSITGLDPGGSAGAAVNGVVGTPTPAGSSSENGGVYTMTAGGPEVSTGTTDTCRFYYFPITNSANCVITARIVSLTGAAVSASTGVMIRESTANNARHATSNAVVFANGLRQIYRTTPGGSGILGTSSTMIARPWWLRLQRAGSIFTAFTSPNGTAWTQIGANQNMALSSEVLAGLAVSARTDGQLSTATFDNVTLTGAPPLQGRTIGYVDAQGSDSAAAGTYTVAGSGAGVGNTQDECHFVAAPVVGDFTLTARVLTQNGGASNAQAGVMVRETANYRARSLHNGLVANAGAEFIVRNSTVTTGAGTGLDYTLAAGTLNFATGDTTQNIPLTIANDALPEPDEQLQLTLRNAYGATLGTSTFVYTIIDDDAPSTLPTVGFATAASAAAEDAGNAVIAVSLGAPSASSVTVDYAVTAGTASSPADFSLAAGTLTFAPGETIRTIVVTLADDSLLENPESVTVTLSNPAGATLGSLQTHVLTIADNEFPVVNVTASDPAASEAGDPGVFTFTRTGSTSGALAVAFARSGTATSGNDFSAIASPGTVTIPDGQVSAVVNVTPLQDTLNEGSETVILTLSPNSNYTVGTSSSATVTIADDDRSTVTIVASDPAASETPGNPGQFTITRTAPTTGQLLVSFSITGTATNGTDYAAILSSFTFAANEVSRTIVVSPANDTVTEGPEQVTVQLASGSYLIGGESYASVTIEDNDSPPTIFVSNPSAQGTLVASGLGLIVAATVTDDGAPQPVTLAWSQLSGPGTATFATPTAAESAVTFSADGTYVLRATAADGQFTVSDSVTVVVGAAISAADWIAQDLGPTTTQRGTSFVQNAASTLTGIGSGFAATATDTAHVFVRQISGDGSVVARLNAVSGPAVAPLAGVTMRDSLARGARRAVLGYVPGSGLQFRYRTTAGLNDSVATAAGVSLPVWLKLDRNNTTGEVTASYAADAGGAPGAWTLVGSPIIIGVEGGAHLGLTATSNSTSALTSAAFDNLALTPAAIGRALIAEDFGSGTPTGTFAETNGTYTIAGSGSMDGSGAFYGRQYYGDLMVTAKLASATSGAQSAKSGLMIRESMDTNAGYIFLGRIPQSAFSGYFWRTFANGASGGVPSFTAAVRWMRLVRRGNSITAFHAPDVAGAPGAWVQLGQPQTVIMSTPVLVGFAVDNSGGTGLNTATFSSLSIVPLNKAPNVEAGVFANSVVAGTTLNGVASDDNFPAPPSLTAQWSQLVGPAAVTFGNAVALSTSATFIADGVYTLRLRASDGSAETFDDVALTAYTKPFAQWQANHFTGGSSNPAALASANGDFDGLSNLVEYAFGTSPTVPNSSPAFTDTVTIGVNKFLRLTVPKNPVATDVQFEVQGTSNLLAPLSWSPNDLVIELNDSTTLRVRDTVPLGTTTPPSRFLRVQVLKP